MSKNSKSLFLQFVSALYDTINKEKEAAYTETINTIKELQFRIGSAVSEYIKFNENIDVRGLSYDKDGIVSGFDYDEFYLYNISNVTFMVRSVDECLIKPQKLLFCVMHNIADCYYEDYDNASWDSEIKEYVFVDSIKIREEHDAKFGCRIELDRETNHSKFFRSQSF